MLIIYTSNKLKTLLKKTFKIIKKNPFSNPLQNELFIVNNQAIEKWMKIFIAEKNGICSNIKFWQYEVFIWKIINNLFPEHYKKYNFHQQNIFWKIFSIIQTNHDFNFLQQKTIMQKFNFSYYMSNLFHQYLIYQSEWMDSWEKNNKIKNLSKHQIWQKKLWRKILKFNKEHNQNNNYFLKIKKKLFINSKIKKIS